MMEGIAPDNLRLYGRVASHIRERILSGRYVPGRRLPAEEALAKELGVSRPTVRSALALLNDEGVISTRRGVGSFVSQPRVRQTLAHLETLDEAISEQGLSPSTEVLDYLFTSPNDAARKALLLESDSQVLFVRRLHLIDDEPIALVEISLPETLGAHFSRRDTEDHAFYDLLATRAGVELGTAVQSMRAESTSSFAARTLRTSEASPALVCERVTYAADGRPIIHALFTYRADRFEFRVTLTTHEWQASWASPGLKALGVETAS
jgi:GntR family transcriptional regulator